VVTRLRASDILVFQAGEQVRGHEEIRRHIERHPLDTQPIKRNVHLPTLDNGRLPHPIRNLPKPPLPRPLLRPLTHRVHLPLYHQELNRLPD